MSYAEYKKSIVSALESQPSGMTWKELKAALKLKYKQPCPEWTKRLENEVGLDRSERKGNALIWKLVDV